MNKLSILGISLMIFLTAFVGERSLFRYPQYFPPPNYNFSHNPLSKEGIQLGRALFYDPILSKDQSISCASCHSPYNAFAHTDHDLSHGINDEIGTRNAPALFNLAWQEVFMWDGAINHLDMQALAPISHPQEMGETIQGVVKKLAATQLYPPQFYAAFGDSSISGERILKALSQFQLTLISANAKYDSVQRGEAAFSRQEKNGYALYQANCKACHQEPLFSSYNFSRNGLSMDTTLNDFGKGGLTHKPQDSLAFKIPSLRNLSYTFPYMHDGRFRKLREVLNHYTEGIKDRRGLPAELVRPIELNAREKVDLISFLKTLDDQEFVFNPDNKYPHTLFFPPQKN